jgi:hypothetical protein
MRAVIRVEFFVTGPDNFDLSRVRFRCPALNAKFFDEKTGRAAPLELMSYLTTEMKEVAGGIPK